MSAGDGCLANLNRVTTMPWLATSASTSTSTLRSGAALQGGCVLTAKEKQILMALLVLSKVEPIAVEPVR